MNLHAKTFDRLIRGSSALSCGGGLPYNSQRELLRKKQIFDSSVSLLDPMTLPNDSSYITISEVGSAAAPMMDKHALGEALRLFEHKTRHIVHGIIPGEIGQEAIVVDSANMLSLPIVDADLAGCRAVPRLSDLALVRMGIDFRMSPLVVVLPDDTFIFVDKQQSLIADENTVRKLVPPGQVVTILGGLVSGETIHRHLSYYSYSQAVRLGEALVQTSHIHHHLPTRCLFGPRTVTINHIAEIDMNGFVSYQAQISDNLSHGTIDVQNEYMRVEFEGKAFAFPQLIMSIDQSAGRGIHSSELHVGMQMTLVVADAFQWWKGKHYE